MFYFQSSLVVAFVQHLTTLCRLFGARMFIALTIGGGCSLLAGFSILMIPVLFVCIVFGLRVTGS